MFRKSLRVSNLSSLLEFDAGYQPMMQRDGKLGATFSLKLFLHGS